MPISQETSPVERDINVRKTWVGLTAEDLAIIRDTREYLRPAAGDISTNFYDATYQIPEFVQLAERSGTDRGRLEGFQKAYFLSLLDATIDEAHVDRSLAIGARHADLGVQPRWVISLFSLYDELISNVLSKHLEGEMLNKSWMAWKKLLQFEMSLLIEGYARKTAGTIESVLDLLFLSSHFRSKVDSLLGDYGRDAVLNSSEVLTLLWLQRDSSTVSGLADVVGLQPNGMSILIDRLSKRRLVTRRRSRQDRRVVFVSLTPDGTELAASLAKQAEAGLDRLLGNLSESERLEYASILTRLALVQA